MIESFTKKTFKCSDGTEADTLAEAKEHELLIIIGNPAGDPEDTINVLGVVNIILSSASKVVDILTTKEGSKPKARAINGGTKKRNKTTPAPVAEPSKP